MNLQSEKLNIIQQVLQINDQLLLNSIKSMLEYGLKTQGEQPEAVTDFWNELTPTQKDNIEQSILELEKGKGIPHRKVMEELRAKYKR